MSAISTSHRAASPPPQLPLYRFTPEQFQRLLASDVFAPDQVVELHDGQVVVRDNGTLSPLRFTVEQYQRMITLDVVSEDPPNELLDGWIVTTMARNPPHDSALWRTQTALLRRLPSEWICRGQSGMTTDASQPEPDLAIVPGPPDRYDDRHPAAHELAVVIEIADSTLGRDRSVKGPIYAQAAIPVYLIVNIPEAHVEVYTEPGPTEDGAEYRHRRDYGVADNLALILDGNEMAPIAVQELLPRVPPK